MGGTLTGIRIVELGGIGPVPHAGMVLADLGADVVRVERPGSDVTEMSSDQLLRGKRVVLADLKSAAGRAGVAGLLALADVALEGFRPGVVEKLGIGPADCAAANPRLVFGRMTGYGQDGPLAAAAGHDINYIALTGALHAIGGADPVPPLNLLGDFGGGSLFLVTGVLAALVERERTGRGQVVDAAIVDGVSVLMALIFSARDRGWWRDERSANLLDGAAPFYRTYRCSDGRHVAVGALELPFYAALCRGLGLPDAELPDRDDPANWPELSRRIGEVFLAHPRSHWESVFSGTDACVSPVLAIDEVAGHPHMAARGSVRHGTDFTVVAPAPRFSDSHPGPVVPATVLDLDAAAARWV
ncbi:alpha-methylacyl-CoA racemase [Nakamurella panacisegetis]|uniref:Alpha-methylacyl-CoA racemase n=1 Tax=Nakamurella panacisegetis TaxID=1090615 RepID=A0A1H0SUX6_9ACTN|nr:CaiB/BaiF CoA-transferase family protein [Nakamurella panacisegetis]SDP45543.1 alpha-methylacyl-CoA racemase [Nakamurella panacisegetis]